MKLRQVTSPKTVQKISPRIISANVILQLSSLELQDRIEQELSENPALELVEETLCPICKLPLSESICSNCGYRISNVESDLDSWRDFDEIITYSQFPHSDLEEQTDPLAQIEAEVTLQEHLHWHSRACLPKSDHPVADYLIANINDRGFLECSLSEVAEHFGVSEKKVERILKVIQSFDPVGVGARNLQECLLIQIDYLKDQGIQNSLAEEMIRRCWTDLCHHKYGKIARILQTSPQEVKSALQFIQKNLNSSPGMQFRVPWNHKPTSPAGSIKPDVIIKRKDKDYEIEVVESREFALQISESYKNLYQEISQDKARYSEEERKHIGNYVERAKMFIRNILHRRRTLYEISKSILEHQREFFDKENKVYLKPLTRLEIARELGKDVSTISRATTNKYMQIPTGEVVPFDQFFGTSLPVKGAIRELLVNETPDKPLSDQEIANILRSRGFKVARRTIAKYRAEMRLLSSDKRH